LEEGTKADGRSFDLDVDDDASLFETGAVGFAVEAVDFFVGVWMSDDLVLDECVADDLVVDVRVAEDLVVETVSPSSSNTTSPPEQKASKNDLPSTT
jgi:hypothetical protein